MSEKPILFNTEMVKAILEGRKIVTRRIIKDVNNMDFIGFISCSVPKGDEGKAAFGKGNIEDISNANIKEYKKPTYKIGDILYVRETWWEGDIIGSNDEIDESGVVLYAADGYIKDNLDYETIKWKPSIHMPKDLSRMFLKVTGVRVERLQDITEEQIINEGVYYDKEIYEMPCNIKNAGKTYLKGCFRNLWDRTIKKNDLDIYSFKANPWVWVIEFEKIEKGCN